MLSGFDPNQIQDLEGAQQAIRLLLNLVEELKSENEALRSEVQELRDEVARLKGEQGKPDIKIESLRSLPIAGLARHFSSAAFEIYPAVVDFSLIVSFSSISNDTKVVRFMSVFYTELKFFLLIFKVRC